MIEEPERDDKDIFEQKKNLQIELQKLLEKCKQQNIDCGPKLIKFIERATHSKKDYSAWRGIVVEILNSF